MWSVSQNVSHVYAACKRITNKPCGVLGARVGMETSCPLNSFIYGRFDGLAIGWRMFCTQESFGYNVSGQDMRSSSSTTRVIG